MKTNIKRAILCSVLLILCGAFTAEADSLSFTGTVTADNHYAIYTGTESSITYTNNRNDLGYWEDGYTDTYYNWSRAETFSFNVNSGDYIYVVAWSDDNIAQGWIGQFVCEALGLTILSNTESWEVYLNTNLNTDLNLNLGDGSAAPTADELETDIAGVTWETITNSITNPNSTWGTIAGISTDAYWIWGSQMLTGSGEGEYQVFRTLVSVPEPATMLLLGSGLLGAAIFRRKRTK